MTYIKKYLYFSYHLCSLFGITPFYSFEKQSPIYKTLNLFLPPIIIVCSTSSSVLLYYNNFLGTNYENTLYVTERLSIGTYFIAPIVTSTVFFCKRWYWVRFMQKFKESLDNINSVYPQNYFYQILLIIFLHLLVVLNVLTHFFKPDEPYWSGMCFSIWNIATLYVNILLLLINYSIKEFYRNLQDILIKVCEEAIDDKFKIDDFDTVTVAQLKNIFTYYVEVCELVDGVSDLFGWTIVLVFTYAFNLSIAFLNRYVNGGSIFASDLMDLFLILTFVVGITLSCDFTANEGKQFISVVYDAEEKFGLAADIRLELLAIAEQGIYYLPKFTLLGLITINRSINLNLVSILTTYIIVVIQFNISYN